MKNDEILYEAKVYAVKLLGKFSYTYHGMLDKLLKKGYSEDVALEVANHYKELGYLDDKKYAIKYIMDATQFKHHGPARIKYDLKHKGVSDNIIEDAFYETDIDFTEALRELVQAKLNGEDITDRKRKDKIIGYLSRKGFDYYEINNALSEYIEEENDI